MEWYYTKDKKQVGPVSQEELVRKISMGEVSSNDYAWREGVADWQPISNFSELHITSNPATGSHAPVPSMTPSPYHPVGGANTTSGLAVASLCLGIASFVVCGLLAIPAVICGHMALSQIKASKGLIEGRIMAIIGLITGYLIIVLFTVIIIIFMFAVGAGVASSGGDYSSSEDYTWDESIELVPDMPESEPAPEAPPEGLAPDDTQ